MPDELTGFESEAAPDLGAPIPPPFMLGVQGGTWHAIDPFAVLPGCVRHRWSVCAEPVLPALDEGCDPQPWEPEDYPASFAPCPECRWTVAGRLGDFAPALASLKDPLARQVADAIIAANRAEGGDMEDPAMLQLLAAVSRHSPVELFAQECNDGECEHPDGKCPGQMACAACSLRMGDWAGESEGRFRAECTIDAPCDPLLSIAIHFEVAT